MPITVAAALVEDGGRLLACQRRAGGAFALKWEFPGGKVEGAETPLAALRRELGEELGIDIEGAREVGRGRHLYPDGTDVDLIFFHVTAYRGAIANRVFEKLRWVSVQDLDGMDFLEGDRPLIEKLVRGDLRLRV